MTQRAKEVAEQIASRLIGQPIHYLRNSGPLLLNEAAGLVQIQLTAERNAVLREAAEVVKKTLESPMLNETYQMRDALYKTILALIKEGE